MGHGLTIFAANVKDKGMPQLQNKQKPAKVWITGGGSGIGAALATHFAGKGSQVIISGRSQEALQKIAGQNCHISYQVCDITDRDQVHHVVADIMPLDLVILNAGAYQPGSSQATSFETYQYMMQVNYFGTLNCLQAVWPYFESTGGHIAINASLAGYRGLPNASGYGPSKAALISLVESWRAEMKQAHIKLQLINPGFVESDLTAKNEFKMPGLISPDIAAEMIYRGLHQKKFEITFPKGFAWQMQFLRCLPYRFYFFLMQKFILQKR